MRILCLTLSWLTAAACGSDSMHPPAQNACDETDGQALASGCSAAYDSAAVYVASNTASAGGFNHRANFWTRGQSPLKHSGAAGSGQAWTVIGACTPTATTGTGAATGASTTSGMAVASEASTATATTTTTSAAPAASKCAAPWSASAIYTSGMTANRNNTDYRAGWWTQSDDPATTSGQAGSGKVWTVAGACAPATTADGTGAATQPTAGTPSQGTPGAAPGKTAGTTPGATSSVPAPLLAPTTTKAFVYSAYKDVSISANWNTSVISTAVTGTLVPLVQLTAQTPAITWSFATGTCGQENWGGIAGQTLASANVASFVAAKKPYIISTGGAAGAFTCGSDAGFTTFLDRYLSPYMLGVDFDIEAGQSPAQMAELVARVRAAQAQPIYSALRFSFTLATLGGDAPQSLGAAGVATMQAIKSAGLQSYFVNLMVMDYGAANPGNCTLNKAGTCAMGLSAAQAAVHLHETYSVPYKQIELTPMIGGNDTQDETFSLADVDVITSFAKSAGLGGVHFWSLDRDRDCAPGDASPICNSYGAAGALGFAQRFAKGL